MLIHVDCYGVTVCNACIYCVYMIIVSGLNAMKFRNHFFTSKEKERKEATALLKCCVFDY